MIRVPIIHGLLQIASSLIYYMSNIHEPRHRTREEKKKKHPCSTAFTQELSQQIYSAIQK